MATNLQLKFLKKLNMKMRMIEGGLFSQNVEHA